MVVEDGVALHAGRRAVQVGDVVLAGEVEEGGVGEGGEFAAEGPEDLAWIGRRGPGDLENGVEVTGGDYVVV